MKPAPKSRLPKEFKQLAGGLSYTSPAPWEWREDGTLLTLAPRRFAHPIQWVTTLVLLPAFSAAIWFLLRGRATIPDAALAAILIALPLFVGTAFVLLHLLQARRGPWLTYDSATDELHLVRLGVSLAGSDVHLVQVVSGVLGQGGSNPRRVSEVHVIVVREAAAAGGASDERTTEHEPTWSRHPLVGTLDSATAREVATRLKRALGKLG